MLGNLKTSKLKVDCIGYRSTMNQLLTMQRVNRKSGSMGIYENGSHSPTEPSQNNEISVSDRRVAIWTHTFITPLTFVPSSCLLRIVRSPAYQSPYPHMRAQTYPVHSVSLPSRCLHLLVAEIHLGCSFSSTGSPPS
jgi:hypothetical protein